MVKPEEIDGLKLPRAVVGGYQADKVDEYLRQIAWDLGTVLRERAAAATKLGHLRQELALHQRRSELEAATLWSARDAAERIREAAREESELMLKKAREHAVRLRRDAELEHDALTREIETLRTTSSKLRTQLRAFIAPLLEWIEPGNPIVNTERRRLAADLERVAHATRVSMQQPGEPTVSADASAAASPPRADAAPEAEVPVTSGLLRSVTGADALPLPGDQPARDTERVA